MDFDLDQFVLESREDCCRKAIGEVARLGTGASDTVWVWVVRVKEGVNVGDIELVAIELDIGVVVAEGVLQSEAESI